MLLIKREGYDRIKRNSQIIYFLKGTAAGIGGGFFMRRKNEESCDVIVADLRERIATKSCGCVV